MCSSDNDAEGQGFVIAVSPNFFKECSAFELCKEGPKLTMLKGGKRRKTNPVFCIWGVFYHGREIRGVGVCQLPVWG